jgi:putative Holliday junction resolvase
MPAPAPRSALALDVGRRRIGLAGCDALGLTVSPLAALQRGDFAADLGKLLLLARQRQVSALVVGLPLSATAEPTPQSHRCRRYGLALQRGLAERGLALPLAWVNEHSSSWEAAARFGVRGDRTGQLDSFAAVLLLEQWLREGPEPVSLPRRGEPVGVATIPAGGPSSAAAL